AVELGAIDLNSRWSCIANRSGFHRRDRKRNDRCRQRVTLRSVRRAVAIGQNVIRSSLSRWNRNLLIGLKRLTEPVVGRAARRRRAVADVKLVGRRRRLAREVELQGFPSSNRNFVVGRLATRQRTRGWSAECEQWHIDGGQV